MLSLLPFIKTFFHLASGNKFLDKFNLTERLRFRTECWVERSISEERMCAADEHIAFTPLNITTPVEGAV